MKFSIRNLFSKKPPLTQGGYTLPETRLEDPRKTRKAGAAPLGLGGGRYSGTIGRYGASKANVQKPGVFSTVNMRSRDAARLLLVLILPPLGMFLVWRGNFKLRGKVFMSMVGVMVMTLVLTLRMGFSMPDPVLPPPQAPLAAPTLTPTPSPTPSLDLPIQPLAGQEILGEDGEPLTAEDLKTQKPTPKPTKKSQTKVYAVRNGAKFYHKKKKCDGQTNARAITLEKAKKEGLKACRKCKPVT